MRRERDRDGGLGVTAPSCWIIKQDAVPASAPGGIRQYRFAEGLGRAGYRAPVVASTFSYLEHRPIRDLDGSAWQAADEDGVPFVWVRGVPFTRNDGRRLLSMLTFAWRVAWLGRRRWIRVGALPKPDVIYASAVPPFAAWAARSLARHHRVPFVLDIGDLWPETPIDMGVLRRGSLVARVLYWLERSLVRSADRIVTPLERAVDYLQERHGVPRDCVVWIPNGADLAHAVPPEPAEATEPAGASQAFTVTYVGAHGPANGLEAILDAAAQFQASGDDVRFVFVGDGSSKTALRARSRDLGLKNVAFFDPVPSAEVPAILASADALVMILRDLPVYRYGISLNKMFAYMASAKPVLLVGAAPGNAVEKADCGILLDDRSPEALAGAIGRLKAMDPLERAAMGARGRAYVETQHRWSDLADRLRSVLDGLVRSKGARS